MLEENWAVRGFLGSVETRERVREGQIFAICGFSGSKYLEWALSAYFSGKVYVRGSRLVLKLFVGFGEKLITASKVDPCIFVCSFVMLWVLGIFGTFMRFRFYL